MCGKTTNWRGRPIGGCSSNEVCHYFKTNCEYKCKYVHGKDSNDDDYINDSTNYNFDINEFDETYNSDFSHMSISLLLISLKVSL